jgi:mono-ADP-ribosyltransferase sirtuin 6
MNEHSAQGGLPEPAKTEFVDEAEVLKEKASQILELVRNARYLVAYTGAGISTAAGVACFRGDKGLHVTGGAALGVGVGEGSLDLRMPTLAHAALCTMYKAGILKFIVSSNHDNLHIKSGIPREGIAELFGNAYIERCTKCKTEYQRHTQVPQLGRQCDDPGCGGRLVRTGIRFGQSVPEAPLKAATDQSKKADVALVLGSSMTVSPFCDLPFESWKKKGGDKKSRCKVIIVSLQDTPYDKYATVKVNSTCDNVMKEIMKGIGMTIENFVYTQDYIFGHEKMQEGPSSAVRLYLRGGRPNEPCTCVERVVVKVEGEDSDVNTPIEMEKLERKGAFELVLQEPLQAKKLEVRIYYKEEYCEPEVSLMYDHLAEGKEEAVIKLQLKKVVVYE